MEPTTGVIACQEWRQPTSGQIWNRDSSNTAWIYAGNINSNLGGALMASGDTGTGPLLGIPNMAPLTNPTFIGTMTLNGFPVALEVDLANLQKELNDYVTQQVTAQFRSQYQQSGTASDVAFLCKYTAIAYAQVSGSNAFPIPYATFLSDGITATQAQELGYGWALLDIPMGLSDSYVYLVETDGHGTPFVGSRKLQLLAGGGSVGGAGETCKFLYWSMAVR